MRWQAWGVALIPFAGGLVVASLLMGVPTLSNPIVSVRVDTGSLALGVGILLSVGLGAGVGLWEWAARRCRQQMTALRAEMGQERRRFLQRLDHEFKNPLTALRAGLANVAVGADEVGHQEALTTMEGQVLRLSQLTADLRKLAELETRELERSAVNIGELLQEAVALTQERSEAEERHLTLTLPQAPWPVPDVSGDWDLLFLAVHNLLDNAVKFSQPGDTVEVRAFEDRGWVVMEVADTGPGIEQSELQRVWEELYRGEAAQGISGSGLGLALVQTIVERHGGEVTLRSRAGLGTVITVRLPEA
jgi:two-component system OmpR family sensor kinase